MAAHLFSQLLQKRDQLGRAVLLDNHHPLVAGDHQVKIGGGLHHAVELVVGDGGEAQRVVGLHMVGVEGAGQHDVLHGGVGVVGLLLHPGADEVEDQRGQHRDDEESDPHRVVVREQGQQHQAGHHDRDDQRPVHHLVLQSAAVAPVLGEGVGGLGLEKGCGFRHLVPSFLMGWSKAQADRSRSGYPFFPPARCRGRCGCPARR